MISMDSQASVPAGGQTISTGHCSGEVSDLFLRILFAEFPIPEGRNWYDRHASPISTSPPQPSAESYDDGWSMRAIEQSLVIDHTSTATLPIAA